MPPAAGTSLKRHARILASSPASQLVGLADVELLKARAYAHRHGGCPYESGREVHFPFQPQHSKLGEPGAAGGRR
jgi:hypothetical protein